MQFGAYTFVETRRDPATGEPVDVDKAFAQVIEQIELADRVGLDVFGLGEHHRPDYAVSAPAVALAAAAARTKRIWLGPFMLPIERPRPRGTWSLAAASVVDQLWSRSWTIAFADEPPSPKARPCGQYQPA